MGVRMGQGAHGAGLRTQPVRARTSGQVDTSSSSSAGHASSSLVSAPCVTQGVKLRSSARSDLQLPLAAMACGGHGRGGGGWSPSALAHSPT
jgi:hypothetical protein